MNRETFEERYYHKIRAARDIGRVALWDIDFEEASGYERRAYDEMVSGLSEAMNGTVDNSYPFEMEKGRLMARDTEPVEHMLNRALANAVQLAAEDPFYNFLVQRNRHELAELHEQESMVDPGADYNTIITLSPYNEELAVTHATIEKLEIAGQKPKWRRAMIRVSHWDGQQLHIVNRSLDNSTFELLKSAAEGTVGYIASTDPTELLGERFRLNVQDSSWRDLAVQITGRADRLLAAMHGGKYQQGRSAEDVKNTHEFVEANSDIVLELLNIGRRLAYEHSTYESYKRAFDNVTYDYAALLAQRFKQNSSEGVANMELAAAVAGAVARAEGQEFNMCGYVLRPGEEPSLGVKTGFESLLRLEGKKINCPECKKSVKVSREKLAAGHLACPECGLDVDVCTGRRTKNSPAAKSQPKKPAPRFIDELEKALREHANKPREATT